MNPHCKEITDQLFEGQTAFQRTAIVNRVFHAKKTALIHNLKNGKYFGGRKAAWIVHVIEFQHRGLPHVHIVYRLEDGPDHSDEEACIAFIDEFISAKMPLIGNPDDEEYRKRVETHMLHKCSNNAANGCLDENCICKKGFSKGIVPETTLDSKGYPTYARPGEADWNVVPHNREMLMDDPDGMHINTEFAASTYTVIYLFKYLFKGNRKITLTLNNTDGIHDEDEINHFLRGRMISSMEACWRILGYDIYPASTPSVYSIKIKTYGQILALEEKYKLSDFQVIKIYINI